MARDSSLLSSTTPTAIAPATIHIGHVQLRDLIICPREKGVVNYVQQNLIVEHNLNKPDSTPRTLVKVPFTPNTLTSLNLDGTDDTLLAAGGQEAEIHLSYHSQNPRYRNGIAWQYDSQMIGSINNSVLLTSLSLTRSNQSSIEPRVGISNNDCTVRFYDVPIRNQPKRRLDEVGCLRMDVPVNHSSISPDGRTLLSVGDSSKVYLHQISGGARLCFTSIRTLTIPSPDAASFSYPASLAASFSTSFSADGLKFAVASQEGVLAVWDVRSTKPLKVFQTDKNRAYGGGNGAASGWIGDDIFDWSGGGRRAPGWSVRNVKFGGSGKELMTFTEHTSLLHVVDARTFETEEIVRVPTVVGRSSPPPVSQAHLQPPQPRYTSRPPLSPHRHTVTSHYPSPTSPRHISPRRSGYQSQPHIVQALGDTFRIASPYSPPSSISDSTWRALRMSAPPGHVANEEEYSDILVIPPLGDREVESDVQALLGGHGIRARTQRSHEYGLAPSGSRIHEYDRDHEHERDNENTGSTHADYEYIPGLRRRPMVGRGDEDMEVDELESDCVSSHTPSRSSSPSPSTHIATVLASPASGRFASPAPTLTRVGSVGVGTGVGQQEMGYEPDLDLAGTCFDPSGRYVYVGSKEAVVEWSVTGGDKQWWFGNGWM
ncbi:WD40-repeat-containing domain protein [Collybia nuda]|uniref:WD40-repeat-containing domain protein n=1 Tax=Collybia nuda TaxID=64659 RepID=A0A9P5YA46_9AGAR|nr:WD40-repeat-containing domain protein [Collybia nuda]